VKGLPAYLLYRFLSGLFGLLPARAVRATGRAAGKGASYIAKDRLRLVRRHMRRILGPAPTEDEITDAGREMFASYGRYWAEVFWFRPRRKARIVEHSSVTGLDPVFAAKADGRGIIFAVAHMGNWEVAGALGESLELPVLAVAEDLPNRRITEWFIETRAAFGIEIIIAGRGSTMATLARGLQEGSVVALVALPLGLDAHAGAGERRRVEHRFLRWRFPAGSQNHVRACVIFRVKPVIVSTRGGKGQQRVSFSAFPNVYRRSVRRSVNVDRQDVAFLLALPARFWKR